jgi:hypothetical protein
MNTYYKCNNLIDINNINKSINQNINNNIDNIGNVNCENIIYIYNSDNSTGLYSLPIGGLIWGYLYILKTSSTSSLDNNNDILNDKIITNKSYLFRIHKGKNIINNNNNNNNNNKDVIIDKDKIKPKLGKKAKANAKKNMINCNNEIKPDIYNNTAIIPPYIDITIHSNELSIFINDYLTSNKEDNNSIEFGILFKSIINSSSTCNNDLSSCLLKYSYKIPMVIIFIIFIYIYLY